MKIKITEEQFKRVIKNNSYLDKIIDQFLIETTIENPGPYLWLLVIPFKTYQGLLGDTVINNQVYPNEPYISYWPGAPKDAFYDICKEIYGLTEEECDYVFERYNIKMGERAKEYFDTHNWRDTGMVD